MTEDKIIEQIRRLLRIASDRGASVNERELAQRRAERLMVRYRIESLPEGDAQPAPAPTTRLAQTGATLDGISAALVTLLIGVALVIGGHVIDRRFTK